MRICFLDVFEGKKSHNMQDLVHKINSIVFEKEMETLTLETASKPTLKSSRPKNYFDARNNNAIHFEAAANRDDDDEEIDDKAQFLKPSTRKKSEDSFVARIKQLGIISGNASKYATSNTAEDNNEVNLSHLNLYLLQNY